MEELSAMMYVNQYAREARYDVIVVDCAPTAESLRFVSAPTTLDWYMKHVFPVQRSILKAVRPIANRVSPLELPPDRYFANVLELAGRVEGLEDLLTDPAITSVRLITNPEQMVLRETPARLRLLLAARTHGGSRDRQSRAARGAMAISEGIDRRSGYSRKSKSTLRRSLCSACLS
jgi:anion-transporting  ArsA/GET3 family ATPase